MCTHEWYLIFTKFWCCVMFSNPSSCYNITYLCITVMIKIHGQISIPLFIHFQFNDCFSNKSKDLNSKYNEKVFLYITLHLMNIKAYMSTLLMIYGTYSLSLSLRDITAFTYNVIFKAFPQYLPHVFVDSFFFSCTPKLTCFLLVETFSLFLNCRAYIITLVLTNCIRQKLFIGPLLWLGCLCFICIEIVLSLINEKFHLQRKYCTCARRVEVDIEENTWINVFHFEGRFTYSIRHSAHAADSWTNTGVKWLL